MSDIEMKMNILIEEANANYNANRFKDAARTFEHLISLAIKNNEPEEAIYFAYRTADCWKKEKSLINRSQIFLEIGNLAFSFGAQLAESIEAKATNTEEKAKALFIAGQCLLFVDPTKAKNTLIKSMKHFEQLAESEKDSQKSAQYLRDALEATILMKNKKQEKDLKIRIANLYIESAEKDLKKKSPENMQSALRSFEDALDMFKELKSKEDITIMTKKIDKLKEKVAEYDPFAT
ncbi:MAG: hypothetical protein ACW96U_04740 [Candidatus Heimdallarchaeaceae archaeon]|jgi:hypothetical protein